MDLYNQFKRISGLKGDGLREKNQNLVRRGFEETLRTSANSYLVQYYNADDIPFNYYEEENVIIDDVSSGIKNTNKDEKRVICSMDSNLKVGSYITWREKKWLITAEELATTSAFKKFTLRPCVVRFTREIAGITYDYPAVFENLSLQTKFSSDIKVDNVDFYVDSSTEQIIIPNAESIKDVIKVNKRIMLNKEKVYMIKKLNTFASQGVIIVSLQQVVENTKDNFDKNIADYNIETVAPPIEIEGRELTITGDKIIKIGSRRKYLAELFINNELDDIEQLNIVVESKGGDKLDDLIENLVISHRTVEFSAKKSIKNINKVIKITASSKVDNRVVAEYEITIKGVM